MVFVDSYINGYWYEADTSIDVYSPYDQGCDHVLADEYDARFADGRPHAAEDLQVPALHLLDFPL